MEKQTPIEILQNSIDGALFLDSKRRWPRPGQYITDVMRPELREILKKLKSDDIANLRPDSIW
ncbi:MAG: hypothetical protein ACTSYO_08140 [Candidatus Ranarchaeia archaeon]